MTSLHVDPVVAERFPPVGVTAVIVRGVDGH